MTPEHFLFIPTVFFLGFFLGGIISKSNNNPIGKEIESDSLFTSFYALGLSLFIFLSIFIATHILPFFGGSKAISFISNGQPLFDQRPVFSTAEFYERLKNFGEKGREIYQNFTYSVDVIFPLAFLGFLLVFIQFLAKRSSLSYVIRKRLMALPIMWFIMDMIENSILFFLISQFPIQNEFLSANLGFVTYGKFCLLFFSIIMPVIVSIFYRNSQASKTYMIF